MATYAWYTTQIDAAQAILDAYNAAYLAIAVQGVQSYTLDTGQTRQVVTHANLSELQRIRQSLQNEILTLEAARDGSGVYIGGPAW